ncbi:hypothetical protein PL373_16030 [Tenacibaculum maritimum]|nr:hypothetical protein [Tenacibaculum maritimum]
MRHYSRLDSNRVTRQKIFDEQNNNYVQATADYEQIVANELQEQIEYNNQPHPNQRKYKGMSRLEVLLSFVNPDLPKLDKGFLAKYIGQKTDTTIRRNQYATVKYTKFQLPTPQTIKLLSPNNFSVEAYYIPQEDSSINEVYLYQNGQFICECKPAPTFNRATAEWTDTDLQGYQEATKYVSQFDKMVKEDTSNKIQKVSIIKSAPVTIDITPEIIEAHDESFQEIEILPVNEAESKNQAINDL